MFTSIVSDFLRVLTFF